jgi:hypothetical protein
MSRWHLRRKNNWWQLKPDSEYLINVARAPFGDPMRARATQISAQKLLDWISRNELTEFGQRNAQRGIRGSKHGPNNEGGGVEDALRLLTDAHYIFNMPRTSVDELAKVTFSLVLCKSVVGSS